MALILSAVPCWAQNQQIPRDPLVGGNSTVPQPVSPNQPFGTSLWGTDSVVPVASEPVDTLRLLDAESCNSWTEAGSKSPTVSVARLAIPGKAESEYQKGCGAFKDKRLDEAEGRVRNAIKLYPSYAAAWVVLGQILDAKHKRDDARAACSQARSVDPGYVAPFLCLADFAASEDDWKEVSILSGGALALDPTGNPYAFYYSGAAEFHLGDLQRAAKDAQNALTLDKWHHLPQVHLLLAQIYQAQGDTHGQAAQLRNYLKYAPNSQSSAGVKSVLVQLEAQTTK
ncbi:MAG: tetratricopeptide repeat protein [Candidatus Acidiferrales bacterium]